MKKKGLLIICIVILILLILIGIVIKISNEEIKLDEEQPEQISEEEHEFLSCLESELGGYLASEVNTLTEIPLNDITDKEDKIDYYKGFAANGYKFIIMKSKESEVSREANLYFNQSYPLYQSFTFNDINVLISSEDNNIKESDIKNACITRTDNGLALPDETINKLNETSKIIITRGEDNLGTISDEAKIEEIINALKATKRYGETFNCDGHAFEFQLYNNDELMDTIYIWRDGKRMMPSSLSGGCAYYTVNSNEIDFREFIEEETDYIFYAIYDYSEKCTEDLRLIYEDEEYRYYLKCMKSDEAFIHFNVSNLRMTLKYALENNYIKPEQLKEYDNVLIKEEK